MKSIKNSFLALSVLSLTACMSTQLPVITQESNEVYQFDDNASFALNVAQMTRKTAGLSDVELPEDAQFKANSGLVGAEYAMSFLTGGLVDLAGSMGAQSQADRAFNWKPMLVFLGDVHEKTVDADALKIVERELTNTFNNIEGTKFNALLRIKSDHFDNNFMLFYKGGVICDPSKNTTFNFTGEIENSNLLNFDRKLNGSCAAGIKIEVVGKVEYKNQIKDVITLTFINGYESFTDMAAATSGFALVPKSYGVWGSGIKYTVPAPYVIHDNTMYLFTKENSSFKLK